MSATQETNDDMFATAATVTPKPTVEGSVATPSEDAKATPKVTSPTGPSATRTLLWVGAPLAIAGTVLLAAFAPVALAVAGGVAVLGGGAALVARRRIAQRATGRRSSPTRWDALHATRGGGGRSTGRRAGASGSGGRGLPRMLTRSGRAQNRAARGTTGGRNKALTGGRRGLAATARGVRSALRHPKAHLAARRAARTGGTTKPSTGRSGKSAGAGSKRTSRTRSGLARLNPLRGRTGKARPTGRSGRSGGGSTRRSATGRSGRSTGSPARKRRSGGIANTVGKALGRGRRAARTAPRTASKSEGLRGRKPLRSRLADKLTGRKTGQSGRALVFVFAKRPPTTAPAEPVATNEETKPPVTDAKPETETAFAFDDMGFPSPPPPIPAQRPVPQVKPDLHEDFDDAGFPIYRPEPPKTSPVSSTVTGGNTMSEYASMIDNSTPETLSRTCEAAADAARRDAAKLTERASEMRVQAAGLAEKPGMATTAEDLVREAGAMEEDAEGRLGLASFYVEKAAEYGAERVA